jgi:hypothetical protein
MWGRLHVLMGLFSVVLGYECSELFVEWSFDYIRQFNIRPTNITTECILNYVKLKMYKEAIFLINESEDFDAGDLREHLVKLKHPVEKFIRKSELLAKEVTLVPAFKWAQSKDTVFLEVRLAHRIDSPACDELLNDVLRIEGRSVSLTGYCESSGLKMRVTLNLELHDEVDDAFSSYTVQSGRVTVNLKKRKVPSVWPQLLKSSRPTNMHVWWELADKYRSELDAFRSKEDI